jgi:hypothetical protein
MLGSFYSIVVAPTLTTVEWVNYGPDYPDLTLTQFPKGGWVAFFGRLEQANPV